MSRNAELSLAEMDCVATDGELLLSGVSIVVPVYNSESTLKELVARLAEVLPTCHERFEVLLVNDGSKDESWSVICQLAEQHSWVRGFNLMRNYGQPNATLCGVRTARYDVTVTMDDDLQHPPEEVPKLLRKLDEGYNVVYGRAVDLTHSWWRNLASSHIKWAASKLLKIPQVGQVSAFRCLRTTLRTAFEQFQGPRLSIDLLLLWGTSHFGSVYVEHRPRSEGHSNYGLFKLVDMTLVGLTAYSTLPLRMATMLGMMFSGFGMCTLLYVVANYFFRGSVLGFSFLAAIISIFGGVQLFTIGIIGEYLGRMYQRIMDAPTYVVHQSTRIRSERDH